MIISGFEESNPHFRCKGKIWRNLKYDHMWRLITKITDGIVLKCRDQKGFETLVVYTLTNE
jgi:hypothetical protein